MRTHKDLLTGVIICGIVGLLLVHPMTRALVLYALPLGSGLDDLVEIAAIVGFGLFLLIRGK